MSNPPEKIPIKTISVGYLNNNNILNIFATISITTCVILFAINGATVDLDDIVSLTAQLKIERINWILITSFIPIILLVFYGIYKILKQLFPSPSPPLMSKSSMPSIFTSTISNSGVVLGLIKHFTGDSKFNKMEGQLYFMMVVICLSIYAFLMMWIRVSGTDYNNDTLEDTEKLSDYGYISFLLAVIIPLVAIIPLMLIVFPKIQWTGSDSIFEARYVVCAMILPTLALLMPGYIKRIN